MVTYWEGGQPKVCPPFLHGFIYSSVGSQLDFIPCPGQGFGQQRFTLGRSLSCGPFFLATKQGENAKRRVRMWKMFQKTEHGCWYGRCCVPKHGCLNVPDLCEIDVFYIFVWMVDAENTEDVKQRRDVWKWCYFQPFGFLKTNRFEASLLILRIDSNLIRNATKLPHCKYQRPCKFSKALFSSPAAFSIKWLG